MKRNKVHSVSSNQLLFRLVIKPFKWVRYLFEILNNFNKRQYEIASIELNKYSRAFAECKFIDSVLNICLEIYQLLYQIDIQMKNTFQNFFREFDLFTAPAGLRIQSSPTLKSCCLGVVSILLFAGLIYLIVTNWISMNNFQKIDFQLSETMIPPELAQGQIKTIAIVSAFTNITQFNRYFNFYWNYFVEGKLSQRHRMVPCKPEHWSQLSESQKYLYENRLYKYHCPNSTKTYQLKKTFSQQNPTYISISMETCKQSQRPDCNTTGLENHDAMQKSGKVRIFFIDCTVNPTNKDPLFYYVNYHSAVLNKGINQHLEVLFKTVSLETDTSIWPFQKKQIINGTMHDSNKNTPILFNFAKFREIKLFEYNFGMSGKIIKYTRKIGKVDEILSYVGGLFSIILPALTWFLISYNKYRFEIKVAQGAFNYNEDGKKIKESDFYFWTYVKYTIYIWLNKILCRKLNWPNCNEIDSVREQINNQMDVANLFQRMQTIQNTINYKIEDKEQVCINLFEPLSLLEIRKQRLKLDYYDEVVKGESAATLQDLLKQQKYHSLKNQEDAVISSGNSAQNIMSDQMEVPKNDAYFYKFKKIIKGYEFVQRNSKFIQTRQQSQKIILADQFREIEDHMAKVYENLDEKAKERLEKRIPMIILHRLSRKNKERKEKKIQEQIKENQFFKQEI